VCAGNWVTAVEHSTVARQQASETRIYRRTANMQADVAQPWHPVASRQLNLSAHLRRLCSKAPSRLILLHLLSLTIPPQSGGSKPAKLETGAVIQVPLFIQQGERIKVDTRSDSYLSRAN